MKNETIIVPLSRKGFKSLIDWYEELKKEGKTSAKAGDIIFKHYPKLHKLHTTCKEE